MRNRRQIRHKCIIEDVDVTIAGEVINFQIKLPKDAKSVVGVEVTDNASYVSAPSDPIGTTAKSEYLYNSIKVGNIKLFSFDSTNAVYDVDLILNDTSSCFGDFFQTATAVNYMDITTQEWWLCGSASEALSLKIDGTNTVIFGVYTDKYKASRTTEEGYRIRVYVYYEPKGEE